MRENKGITLIALVVTIIILLILAGVAISTISSDGLLGRAETSAAKYQAASEAEESAVSEFLDKYDRYESELNGAVTISWENPIATRGAFINSLTPESSRSANFYDKEVVVIKPNGDSQLLNPYHAESTTAPAGSKLRFYYYCDKTSDYTYTGIRKNSGSQVEAIAEVAVTMEAAPIPANIITVDQCELKNGALHYIEMNLSGYIEAKFILLFDGIDEGDITYNVWDMGCILTKKPTTSGNISLTWNSPIAIRGSFINNLNPDEYVNSNFYDKQIVAVKPNGTTQILNPYQSVNVQLPVGTKLRFYYYRDKDHHWTYCCLVNYEEGGPYALVEEEEADGKLRYAEITLNSDITCALGSDEIYEDGDYISSDWIINISGTSNEGEEKASLGPILVQTK